MLFGLGVLVYINLRGSNQTEINVISRIMTNYLQIVTSIALLNLSWP